MQRESALDKLRNQHCPITLTKEILDAGKSINGGWNREQLMSVGVDNFVKGWFKRLVGKQVSEDALEKFMSLKDAHTDGRVVNRALKKHKIINFEPVAGNIGYADQYKHPNWQRMRLLVLKRDGFTCVNCRAKEKMLHAHHLKYLKGKFIWEVPIWYIVTLCEDCHSEEHGRNLRL